MPKLVPISGKVVVVDEIPDCDICKDGTPGPYDFKTKHGPWAHGCEKHFNLLSAGGPGKLGVGIAQLWITADQVDATG